MSIDRQIVNSKTDYIESKHIIPETGGTMPVYHLVLQLSDVSRKKVARDARKG